MRKLDGEEAVTAELKLRFLYQFWRIEPDAFPGSGSQTADFSFRNLSKIRNWNSSLYSRVFD